MKATGNLLVRRHTAYERGKRTADITLISIGKGRERYWMLTSSPEHGHECGKPYKVRREAIYGFNRWVAVVASKGELPKDGIKALNLLELRKRT